MSNKMEKDGADWGVIGLNRIRKNRGKLALILGFLLGVNYVPIMNTPGVQYAVKALKALTGLDDDANQGLRRLELLNLKPMEWMRRYRNKSKSKPDSYHMYEQLMEQKRGEIENKLEAEPNACNLYQQTALSDSPQMRIFCESTSKPTNDTERQYAERVQDIDIARAVKLIKRIQWPAINIVAHPEERTIDEVLGETIELEPPVLLRDLKEPYRSTLESFDPATFKLLSDFLYIQNESIRIEGWGYGKVVGAAIGPGQILHNQYLITPEGKYYVAFLHKRLPEIDLETALIEGNKEQLGDFLNTMDTLAHEIDGHIKLYMENPDRMIKKGGKSFCEEDDIPGLMEGEIYSYYRGAQMVDFLVEKYPVMKGIVDKEIAIHKELRKKHGTNSGLHQGVMAEFDDKYKKKSLMIDPGVITIYEAYRKAKKTGDWSEFRDLIAIGVLTKQFSLVYLLTYFRDTELTKECYQGFNQRVKAIILDNKEPPQSRRVAK